MFERKSSVANIGSDPVKEGANNKSSARSIGKQDEFKITYFVTLKIFSYIVEIHAKAAYRA